MSRVVDLRGDAQGWDDLVAEVDALSSQLPDGERRVTQFVARMEWAQGSDDYLTLEAVAEGGIAVMRCLPGPKALAFVAELRRAVAAL